MAGSPTKRARRAGKLPPAPPSSRARGAKLSDDPPEFPPRRPGESQPAYLDRIGIDTICALIRSGMMLQEISRALGITSKGLISTWINSDDTRRAAETDALTHAAKAWDALALESIQELKDDATTGAIARARELANHLRWRASKLGRAVYGERVDVQHGGKVEITGITLEVVDPVAPSTDTSHG